MTQAGPATSSNPVRTITPQPQSQVQSRELVPSGETAAAAVAARAKAMIEARYIIAMQKPRDLDDVRQRLLDECERPGFAEAARYNKPVGGGVQGLSIRFVEAALRCMGNIPVLTQTTFDNDEVRIINVSVGDLESNVWYDVDITVSKTVERSFIQTGDEVLRKRTNKKGKDVFIIRATDDDILNKQNALISKAIRNAGLRLVPGGLQDECEAKCIKIVTDKDAADPGAAKNALFDGFVSVGVTVEQIKQYLGHEAKSLTPRELSDLRLLFVAIRDGEATWRDAMDAKTPAGSAEEGDKQKASSPAAEKLRAKLEADRKKRETPRTPASSPTGQPAAPAAPAPADQQATPEASGAAADPDKSKGATKSKTTNLSSI